MRMRAETRSRMKVRATRRRTNHKGRRAIGEGCAGAREYNDEIRARRRKETNRRKEHEGEETTVTDRSAGAKTIGKLWRRRNEAN
jgi:hypothetical protein